MKTYSGMTKHVIVTKVDFVEPYKVELLPNLSLKAKPELIWTFSKLIDAVEIGQGLAKRHDARFAILGDDITSEMESLMNNNLEDDGDKATLRAEQRAIDGI